MTNVIPLPPRSITVSRKADRQVLIRVVGSRGHYTLLMGKVELATITKQARHCWVNSGPYPCTCRSLTTSIRNTVRQLELGRLLKPEAA